MNNAAKQPIPVAPTDDKVHDHVADVIPLVTRMSPAARLIRTGSTRLAPDTTINSFLPEVRKVWNRTIDIHGSLDGYESTVIHHILPFFDGTALQDWDTGLMIKFIEDLDDKVAMTAKLTPYPDGRKLSQLSKERILAILSGICQLATTHQLLSINPLKDYGKLLKHYSEKASPQGNRTHRRARPIAKHHALTIEERDLVLLAARSFLSVRYYAYYQFLAGTGVRPSEAAALRWERLDLEGRTTSGTPVAYIRSTFKRGGTHIGKTKSGRHRIVELAPAVVQVLTALKALRPDDPKAFVFTRPNGRPFSQAFRNQVWAVVLGLAGMTRWLPVYCLRHTYASILINGGTSITYVSQQLGHYNDEVTRTTYLHWLPVKSSENLSRLGLKE